jgi:hypothetical protein
MDNWFLVLIFAAVLFCACGIVMSAATILYLRATQVRYYETMQQQLSEAIIALKELSRTCARREKPPDEDAPNL